MTYKTADEKKCNFEKFLKGKSFLPLIVIYHPSFSSDIFKFKFADEWNQFVSSDSDLLDVFANESPQIVFKRGITLANILTHTRFDCCSSDVIYLIKCDKCNAMYEGQTARPLKDRLNNHRSDVKLHKNTAIAKHFNESGHFIVHLRIMPIEYIASLSIDTRLQIEKQYMTVLNTRYPNGLNCYYLI